MSRIWIRLHESIMNWIEFEFIYRNIINKQKLSKIKYKKTIIQYSTKYSLIIIYNYYISL